MSFQRKLEPSEELKRASEVLLHYVSPLMRGIPPSISPQKLASILTLPVAVWNAIAMSQWGHSHDYLELMYKNLESSLEVEKDKTIEALNFWANRKEELFPDDIWAWEFQVFRDLEEKLRIKTEIRIPHELRHLLPVHWQSKEIKSQSIPSHQKYKH